MKQKVNIKIQTSIIFSVAIIIVFISSVMIYFQYKSSNEFATLMTKQFFKTISTKVVRKIQIYDRQSMEFLNVLENIKGFNNISTIQKQDKILPIISKHIKNTNYIYGIYIGYLNNDFYIIYNLDLSQKIKKAQNAPKKARWLVKKNITNKNGTIISYKTFLDNNFNIILEKEQSTEYKPTQRPWYKDAIKSNKIIKTQPYIFSSLNEAGVTYAKKINNSKGIVIALDITLNSLNKLLASSNLVKGSVAFIFKKDGKIIGQADTISNKHIKNINDRYKNIFIKNHQILDLGKQVIITLNNKRYFKYTALLNTSFSSKDYLTILSPIDVIMQPYKEKIYHILFITIMTLIFILLPIIFYMVKFIVKPITQLQEENKKIEIGKFKDVKPVFSSIVEINTLSNSLISMAKSIEESNRTLEHRVEKRTADLLIAHQEINQIHKNIRDSIEYASLIQGTLIPEKGAMKSYFKDYFATWIPKDTVGGDIWLFEDLRNEDECLLMFIDCTGHGVPGAFVTMIIKAVEREIVSIINSSPNMIVSPAWIMGYFNKTIKKLLKQETKDSLSNVGFDGGIIYYNQKEQILKFAGAETPLFYITKDGSFFTIKGNRYSVGYKKCDVNYQYKEIIINVEEGMKFFCTTDGYLDQNGGEKDFPFGKKRFCNIIKKHYKKNMGELQSIFQMEMMEYENVVPNNERNDDITLLGFEIGGEDKNQNNMGTDIELSKLEEVAKYTKSLTLLYVDDDKDTRDVTLMILEELFDNIIVAVDGEDGFEKFKENNIDLIITDINMPKMNGLEMSKKIKQIDLYVPIIVLTAFNDKNLLENALNIGIDSFINKPLEGIELLVEKLEKIIQNIEYTKIYLEQEKFNFLSI